MELVAHCVSVDRHGDLHPDLHARVGIDRFRVDLAGGGRRGHPRQLRRARTDRTEFARRHALRHSLPRARARVVWRARRQHSGPAARARGVRLVRHPDVDRRVGDLQARRGDLARHRDATADPAELRGAQHGRVSLLHDLLGDERLDRAARHGLDQVPGDLGFSISPRRRCSIVHLGMGARWRSRYPTSHGTRAANGTR